jgi:hypothetical protein
MFLKTKPADADPRKHRRAAALDYQEQASIAAKHSGAACSFFGSAAMYSSASRSVTSLAQFDRLVERPPSLGQSFTVSIF